MPTRTARARRVLRLRQPSERLRHLYTLTEFDDEALLLETCEFVMTPAVKTQNAPFVLRSAISNRRHGDSVGLRP